LEADISDFASGALLSQLSLSVEKWHPVAFYSKSLSPVERNYEIHDKEMLAIIQALEEWRHFLEGTKHTVEIWSNHKNLEYFMTAKNLNWRQARWSLFLVCFNFQLHHCLGKTMGKSNALSQRSNHGTGSEDNKDIILLTPEVFAARALTGVEIDGEERSLLQEVRKGNRDGLQEESVAKAGRELHNSGTRSI